MGLSRSRSVVLLAAAVLLAWALGAAGNFASWWPQFQASVAKGDAPAVAQAMRFPVPWENGATREIRTRENFVAHFASYLTPEIGRAIARGKPQRLPNGRVHYHLESPR